MSEFSTKSYSVHGLPISRISRTFLLGFSKSSWMGVRLLPLYTNKLPIFCVKCTGWLLHLVWLAINTKGTRGASQPTARYRALKKSNCKRGPTISHQSNGTRKLLLLLKLFQICQSKIPIGKSVQWKQHFKHEIELSRMGEKSASILHTLGFYRKFRHIFRCPKKVSQC